MAWRASTATSWRRPVRSVPQIGDGEADRGERGGAGLADAERRRQDRIGVAGDLDRAGALAAPAGDRQDRTQGVDAACRNGS